MTTLVTLPWLIMVGLMRLPLKLWLETGRVSKSLLKCWERHNAGIRAYAEKAALSLTFIEPWH
jgi:hypothetical protein